ncbi:hypothetical protein CFC21_041061 [Triticum aestivum]|uniref:DUF1618 domain-containing protein n=2 Tax=Triticum aestivum TaxID=4565 RepID=A0A3B6FPS2_WHEAT|nr:hypothetical protein CFC21_041061 [Triticum aestivum]
MEGLFQPTTVDAAATSGATPTRISTTAATPTIDAAATTNTSRYPPWVPLEEEANLKDCENATTAEAQTSTGHIVKVTFVLADPPSVSRFCVHGPELKGRNFDAEPRVVFSYNDHLLLRFAFTLGPRSTLHEAHLSEYFVYKACPGKPSITPIPTAYRPDKAKSYLAILPCSDDYENFVVADLAMTQNLGHYVLHIFSSKMKKLVAKPLQLQASSVVIEEDLPSLPHKVIALGADTIGWIDLWRGIVVCNLFDPDPVLNFTPLPKPEFNLERDGTPRPYRDVTFCNGFIKFMEIYHCVIPDSHDSDNMMNFKTMKDLDSTDVIYDSELFFQNSTDLMEDEEPTLNDAWKIRTCYRHTSWNLWCKGHNVHVDDILVNNQMHSMMLPELWDGSTGKFTLRNLITGYPTLCIHNGDVVYLVSKVELFGSKAWVIGVDLQKKTVEVIKPYSAHRCNLSQTPFLACTFSRYLNTTPRYVCSSHSLCVFLFLEPLNTMIESVHIPTNYLLYYMLSNYLLQVMCAR